jgi:hypothetical protein
MGNIFFKKSVKDTNNACIAVGVDGMIKKRKLNITSNEDDDTSDDENDNTTIKSKKFKYSNAIKETSKCAQKSSGKFSFLNRIFKRKSLSFTGQSYLNDDAFKDDGSLIDSFLNLNNNNNNSNISHHVDSKINSFSSLVLHASSKSSSLSSSSNGNLRFCKFI